MMVHPALLCLGLVAGLLGVSVRADWNYNHSYYSWGEGGSLPPPREAILLKSACNPHEVQGGEPGFACVHMSMLSDDMVLAAKRDRLDGDFNYAVAGGNWKLGTCGQCFQIKVQDGPGDKRKQLIVQVINTGFDVAEKQLDIMMAAGGFGWFTACNIDCNNGVAFNNYCKGGPCSRGFYDGSFQDWIYNEVTPTGPLEKICYKGGLRLSSDSELGMRCGALSKYDTQSLKGRILSDSCWRTHTEHWRRDFDQSWYQRVRCPPALTALTGLRLDEDDTEAFDKPKADLPLTGACQKWNNYDSRGNPQPCLTTMMDCCVPSCSWVNGNNWQENVDPNKATVYKQIDRCFWNGTVAGRVIAQRNWYDGVINFFGGGAANKPDEL